MFPLELDKKTPWPQDKARAKFRELRLEAITELRARDAESGIAADGKVYSQDDTGFAVDWHKASMKHTGDEAVNLTIDKWDEWCSQPRDSQAYTGETRAKRAHIGPKVEENPSGQSQFTPKGDESPMRVKRGRPIGSKNREPVAV